MGYVYPVGDIYVPADWFNHCCERNPPSSEPGTDYASAYGTTILSPGAGKVTDVKTTNSSGTGRYVRVSLDDGRTSRALHMSSISVSVGQRVTAGQALGKSGASGYGSDWYYGSHLHQTLWPHGAFANPTIDFERYVGGTTPPPSPTPEEDEDDMPGNAGFYYTRSSDKAMVWYIVNPGSGFFLEWADSGNSSNEMARVYQTGSFAKTTEGMRNAQFNSCALVRNEVLSGTVTTKDG